MFEPLRSLRIEGRSLHDFEPRRAVCTLVRAGPVRRRGAHVGHRGGLVTKRAEKCHTTQPFLSVTPCELPGHLSAAGEPRKEGRPEGRGVR